MDKKTAPIAGTIQRNNLLTTAPAPMTRASCVPIGDKAPSAALYSGKSIGCESIVAVVSRDTSDALLNEAQRLSHYPASSLICLSWHNTAGIGLLNEGSWKIFHANVLLSGSQFAPTVSWSPYAGRGGMMYFTVSEAQKLFNIDITALQDRSVCARQLLGSTWFDMFDQLVSSKDDATMLRIIKHHFPNKNHPQNSEKNLQYVGRLWVESLISQAESWESSLSPRQVERKIKAASGRSLREWQQLVRTEEVFFKVAQDKQKSLKNVDWSSLAIDMGFSDQAHLIRAVKRITGFPPAEFTRRFIQDESFWIYRLWA